MNLFKTINENDDCDSDKALLKYLDDEKHKKSFQNMTESFSEVDNKIMIEKKSDNENIKSLSSANTIYKNNDENFKKLSTNPNKDTYRNIHYGLSRVFVRCKFGKVEYSLAEYFRDLTCGFDKKDIYFVSINHLSKVTGFDRNRIKIAINSLIEKNVLIVFDDNGKDNVRNRLYKYAINVQYDEYNITHKSYTDFIEEERIRQPIRIQARLESEKKKMVKRKVNNSKGISR